MPVAGNEQPDAVSALLKAGSDPKTKDTDSVTALMMEDYIGNTEIVEILKDAGAPNSKTPDQTLDISQICANMYVYIL